jgi:vacuolar-type H+-ATPase subunit H
MPSAIESTVRALVEFEAELEKAKVDVSEAKRRTMKDAVEWAEEAKAAAISKAQAIAASRVSKAREDAEAGARTIREKGESDLEAFENSISKNRSRAAELVAARLLGEPS